MRFDCSASHISLADAGLHHCLSAGEGNVDAQGSGRACLGVYVLDFDCNHDVQKPEG